ncbi:hypothetical protein FHS42_003510 [Streptomyces zagrosensis]|uniref:Uncharacterized protein n=1 Tax=Streptomyces zagrosensis TaxID=1042984 RepID=A0A7W9UYY2_9ACTN|nr:hypothetical protein [Streptomyces zagrosensis]
MSRTGVSGKCLYQAAPDVAASCRTAVHGHG